MISKAFSKGVCLFTMQSTIWRHITTRRIMIYMILSGFLFRSATLFGGNMQDPVVDLATSIVEFAKLDVNAYYFNTPDIAFKDGNYYSGMAPGTSLLAVPFYAAAKGILLSLPSSTVRSIEKKFERKSLVSYSADVKTYDTRQRLTHVLMTFVFGFLGGALGFWLIVQIAQFLTGDLKSAQQIGLAYAFGTVMIFYNNSYYTQSIGVLMMLIAVYLLLVLPPNPLGLLCGGFFCGFAATVDYPFMVYGGIVALFGAIRLWRARRSVYSVLLIGAGMITPLMFLFAYHAACFGGPFKTPYAFRAHGTLHAGKYLGLGPLHIDRIQALFVSPDEGLLWLMPFVLLFPVGAWAVFKKYRRDRDPAAESRIWLLAAGLSIIAAATAYFISIPWVSNMAAYGPRFLLAAIPFMVIFAYPFDRRLHSAFWVLVGYSVLINQLNMAKMNLPLYCYQLMTHQTLVPLSVQLSQIKRHFAPVAGLTILIASQLILVTLVFVVPDLLRRKRSQPQSF